MPWWSVSIESYGLVDDSLCDQVWRYKVIYQGNRLPTWILMFLPCLMFAGSVGQHFLVLLYVREEV